MKMDPILNFFDAEFTDLCIGSRLISIGLISEDGREFYAELSDTYLINDCSAFVQEAVLPHLEGGEVLMPMHELTLRLGGWLEAFKQPVKLATDSIAWDWPWIHEIFGEAGTWPANLEGQPEILKQEPDFNLAIEQAYAGDCAVTMRWTMPERTELRKC